VGNGDAGQWGRMGMPVGKIGGAGLWGSRTRLGLTERAKEDHIRPAWTGPGGSTPTACRGTVPALPTNGKQRLGAVWPCVVPHLMHTRQAGSHWW